jgi:ABC-type multidrug transport system ATPase subunit
LLLADEPTGELDTQMAVEVFQMLGEMNRVFGVTVVIVTHYPGVAQYVDRVVHIRDGRISSESYLQSTFQRSGPNPDNTYENEYLVVDRAGRLQLPQECVTELGLNGLALAQVEEDRVIITKAPQTRA